MQILYLNTFCLTIKLSFIPESIGFVAGAALFIFGVLLNLWTLQVLGIKGTL